MGEYDRSVAQALRMIENKGRSIVLRTKSGNYLPSEDDFANADHDDVTVKALFTEYKDNQVDGELIRRGDKRLLIAAAALASSPAGRELVIDGDDTYKVIDIKTLQPGDAAILYYLQVRK